MQMVLGMVYSGTMEDDHMDAPYAAGDLVFLKWWEGSKNNLGLVIRMCPPFHQPMASSDWMAEVSFSGAEPRWMHVSGLALYEESTHGG